MRKGNNKKELKASDVEKILRGDNPHILYIN